MGCRLQTSNQQIDSVMSLFEIPLHGVFHFHHVPLLQLYDILRVQEHLPLSFLTYYVLLLPTGLQTYSTVSQSPSAGMPTYTGNISLHFSSSSNHWTSCSTQVLPRHTVNNMCHIVCIRFATLVYLGELSPS